MSSRVAVASKRTNGLMMGRLKSKGSVGGSPPERAARPAPRLPFLCGRRLNMCDRKIVLQNFKLLLLGQCVIDPEFRKNALNYTLNTSTVD